jgi:hypothetical protein
MSGEQFASDDVLPPDANSASVTVDVASDSDAKSMFDEHKGKLAIGVAATLGIMVFYNWWEKRLAKTDPEDYARLRRLKAVVRTDTPTAEGAGQKQDDATQVLSRTDNTTESAAVRLHS